MSEDRKYKHETLTGRTYWEDESGKRQYEGETFTGREYREDGDGNREYKGETFTGRKYREDSEGNRTYEDEIHRGTTWSGTEYEEKKGGCFLTTACVEHASLSDDCHELQQLRNFRDSYVMQLPDGQAILERYYAESPRILNHIMKSPDYGQVLSSIFETVRKSVQAIETENNEAAFLYYSQMFLNLSAKFFDSSNGLVKDADPLVLTPNQELGGVDGHAFAISDFLSHNN